MFIPFSGWLFDPAMVADPGKATSPPYDVISDEERTALLERSPHNIVRLLLPGTGAEDYERAGSLLRSWRDDGVLVHDDTARFYVYETDYSDPAGILRRARGVVGALELLPLGRRVVPHEETMGKHRADRLSILRSTQANLDPIVALSAAPDLPPLLDTSDRILRMEFEEDDGSTHRLYELGEDTGALVAAAVDSHPVSIADGHHRYTTALGYREDLAGERPGPWDYIMTMVAPAEGSGLTIGPYHRLLPAFDVDVSILEGAFEVTEVPPGPPSDAGSIVLVHDGSAHHLRPRPRALSGLPAPWREASAAVAGEVLYPLLGISEARAGYVADAAEAVAAARSQGRVALLVAPVTEHAVAKAGEMGLRFPTKTTYFTPKPRAGLVVRCFDD